MGRAHEVRAASMAKTAAAKSKLNNKWSKIIYMAAKAGVPDPELNQPLKKEIEKAKKEQVTADVIKRAIEKAKGGSQENYSPIRYEAFGPNNSMFIIDCLTDNVNRTVSLIRAALNKTSAKMGAMGSVAFMYDNLSVVSFKGLTEDETLEALIEAGVDADIELQGENIVLYGKPSDLYAIKEAITSKKEVEFEVDEITMIPKDTVTLEGEALEDFNKLLTMLDEIEDVNHVYHNVNL